MKPAVLIVDDSPAAQELATAFEASGFIAAIAPDSSTATERIGNESFAAILLDPMLRGRVNGFSVLSFIELDHPDLVERTFLVTALSEQTVMHTAPDLLPRLFRKPADIPAVLAAIRTLGTPETPPKPDGPRVLIVEDDAATASLMAGLLMELGYSPSLAESGREAIRQIVAADYALLLLDLMIPDVDGFALLQYIEETRPFLLERVIVSTGVPDRFLAALDNKPIRGVLHKPVRGEELNRLLARADLT